MWNQISLFPFTKVRSGGTKQQKVLLEVQPQLLPVCRGSTKPRVGAGWPRGVSPAPLAAAALLATAEPGGTGRKPKYLQDHWTSTISTHSMMVLKVTLKEIGLLGQLSSEVWASTSQALNRAQTHPTASDPKNSFRAVASQLYAWGKTSSLINFL